MESRSVGVRESAWNFKLHSIPSINQSNESVGELNEYERVCGCAQMRERTNLKEGRDLNDRLRERVRLETCLIEASGAVGNRETELIEGGRALRHKVEALALASRRHKGRCSRRRNSITSVQAWATIFYCTPAQPKNLEHRGTISSERAKHRNNRAQRRKFVVALSPTGHQPRSPTSPTHTPRSKQQPFSPSLSCE